ncbi:MAG: MarR family winged helix-turn-helix transcriptional regulator [Hominenteromicrobium sp.]
MELYQITGRLHKLELVRMLAHRRETQEYKLYFGQMPVLDYISDHPGCTQIEIADFQQVSPASIALSTKRLQKAGYLVKEVDAENLRCKRLYLSEEGQRIRSLCRERMDQLDARAFQGFSEEELCRLAEMLDRITMNITGEKENIVNGATFNSLHHQLETVDKGSEEI